MTWSSLERPVDVAPCKAMQYDQILYRLDHWHHLIDRISQSSKDWELLSACTCGVAVCVRCLCFTRVYTYTVPYYLCEASRPKLNITREKETWGEWARRKIQGKYHHAGWLYSGVEFCTTNRFRKLSSGVLLANTDTCIVWQFAHWTTVILDVSSGHLVKEKSEQPCITISDPASSSYVKRYILDLQLLVYTIMIFLSTFCVLQKTCNLW